MSNLRYTSDPLATGAWRISDWNAGQSDILRWSPKNVLWNDGSGTIDLVLGRSVKGSGGGRPYAGGEIQSVESATTGTWSWTAQAPHLTEGSVFGLFTYRADHFNDPWIEFDFEFLGKDAADTNDDGVVDGRDGAVDIDGDGNDDLFEVRLNIHMEYIDPATGQPVKISLEELNGWEPVTVDLRAAVDPSFDASTGMHTYSVTVTDDAAGAPGQAVFYVDGTEIGRFDAGDMGGTWNLGPMRSFANLWCVDNSEAWMDDWAGTWTYPGEALVARIAGATYAPVGGSATLIGGGTAPGGGEAAPGPAPTIEGTAAGEAIRDVLRRSDVIRGAGGQDVFLFVPDGIGAGRGGAAERDVILDFSPVAGAEHDIIEVSKALVGVKGFSGLYRKIADTDGDAVLTFADGSTLRFEGLAKADLSYDDFVLA